MKRSIQLQTCALVFVAALLLLAARALAGKETRAVRTSGDGAASTAAARVPAAREVQARVSEALHAGELARMSTLDQLRQINLMNEQLRHHREILSQTQAIAGAGKDISAVAQQAVELEKMRLIADQAVRHEKVLAQVREMQSQNLEALRAVQGTQHHGLALSPLVRLHERRAWRRRSSF